MQLYMMPCSMPKAIADVASLRVLKLTTVIRVLHLRNDSVAIDIISRAFIHVQPVATPAVIAPLERAWATGGH